MLNVYGSQENVFRRFLNYILTILFLDNNDKTWLEWFVLVAKFAIHAYFIFSVYLLYSYIVFERFYIFPFILMLNFTQMGL